MLKWMGLTTHLFPIIFIQIQIQQVMGIEEIRKHLKGKYDDKVLTQVLQSPFIEQGTSISFEEWRKSFVGAFILKTPDRIHLLRYIAAALEKETIKWSDFTTSNVVRIRDYIIDSVSANSASVYCNIIKALLNENHDNGKLPNANFSKVLTVRKEPSQNIALTPEEITKIEQYQPKNKHEKAVKAQFLCEYYCGARSSDIQQLTEKNIIDGNIVYVSQKTRVETSVPLHKNFLKYFRQRGKVYSRPSYNRIIKRICQNCEINENVKIYYHGKIQVRPKYELIGSHTARRSFVTNLAKRGVNIEMISALAGHTSVAMTNRYLCVDTKNVGNAAMAFFNS